ncbi:DUF4303 domain-containing protein [Occultella glacieicola]|uniref:DUF4303 domain-containing protein n=1 Tax=Occultella glacieicola TaxID=2518684 RepID=A0ABY2E0P1_9MICO|nr:DUF4303 domain-containing protein [Occultella glacieicola]TDE91495.1 DUF4303 domain-containing protein [Occultella glacieicola]
MRDRAQDASAELEAWVGAFGHTIGIALEQAIVAVTSRLPAGDIVGVGVATDADATSIVALANSRQNLDRMIAEEPQFAVDSTWHLGEWDMDVTQVDADDPLAPVRAEADRVKRLITSPGDGRAPSQHLGEFRAALWDAIAHALAQSATHGFFDRWPSAKRVFLPLDADVSEERIAAWNTPFNRPEDLGELREFLQLD